jgi:hypothetical protein
MAVSCLLVVGFLVAADTGSITGTVDKPKDMKAIVAIDRATDKKFTGKVDKSTGKFTVESLPVGAKYDLIMDYGLARLEGVNLKVPPADNAETLTKADLGSLKTRVKELNQFEDVVEVLAIRGNGEHAAVFLNKLRTKPFVNSNPGEIVWRVELWHFEKAEETWIKVQDELFTVYYRERIQKTAFDQKVITFDPGLGGLEVTREKPNLALGEVKLPAPQSGIRLRQEGGRP